MNKKDAHLYLPFVQALADGKTLQIEVGSEWDDIDDPLFTRPPQDYRIKPEPRKWTVWVDPNGFIDNTGYVWASRGLQESPAGWEQIEVTEILPENKQ